MKVLYGLLAAFLIVSFSATAIFVNSAQAQTAQCMTVGDLVANENIELVDLIDSPAKEHDQVLFVLGGEPGGDRVFIMAFVRANCVGQPIPLGSVPGEVGV